MIRIKSRTNSPYKIQYQKNPYVSQFDLINVSSQSQGINSLYSPSEDAEINSSYPKKKVITPHSANKVRRKISNNNQSFDLELKHSPLRFSSEADLTNTMIPFQKSEDLKLHQLQTRVPARQFVLKKIDLQKINNNQQNRFDLRYMKISDQSSISPKLDEQRVVLQDKIKLRSSINGIRPVTKSKVKSVFDSSQTTDDYSDEIECAENILQHIKIQESLESRSLTQPSQKTKSVRLSDDVEEISDSESEEEYNIWPNNSEVLMRGIDFENFTDNHHLPLFPQVIYKVRSIFYNQFQQTNTDVTKQTKQFKSNSNAQNAYKENLEYIPNDKRVQQDFQILKEFASVQEKRKRRNQERAPSPKKFKNHFIVQIEREKFFQNLQIHQSIQQTPQFIAFQQYFNKYRKVERTKQRGVKYQRYPITSLTHVETQQSISKRIKSSSSNQGTPRHHLNTIRNKPKNATNFSQFMIIDNQLHSPLIPQEKSEVTTNRQRCTSNIKSRNISSMNSNNASVHLYKYMKQGTFLNQDFPSQKPKSVKKQYNSILDEIVIQSKI